MNNNLDRNELLKSITKEEQLLQAKLQELNLYEYDTIMGVINKTFYDKTATEIHKYFNQKKGESIKVLLNNEHLKYRLDILRNLNDKISREKQTLLNESPFDSRQSLTYMAGFVVEEKRKDFVKNNKITPFHSLKNENSIEYYRNLMNEKLVAWKKYDKKRLEEEYTKLKANLKTTLPTLFNDPKAYGTCIGIINRGFYEHSQTELKDVLNDSTKLSALLDEEHLRYRILNYYVAASLLKASRMDTNNTEVFRDYYERKISQISKLSKDIYIENSTENYGNKETPLDGLKRLSKQRKEEKKQIRIGSKKAVIKSTKRKNEESYENGEIPVQLSFYQEEKGFSREREEC